ncbi:MAG: lysylphosphatidylglycerol synthase transmembrane domain-containing protein [bacterium]|nr:lysylphosphatidylglycerol synthase transmembrane domain-containing protein [bacterium]MCY3890965.1 lysylphosphatidylglycerol synthase transmembrane domain-containing protein [bacterium]MCY3962152.1 lysylphosphatidylglycerol synthase transmembrane domain-containing protein [bacterium]MCY4135159.1 lysylphosphatidylglycerol synthase transmembrane domain-containing protein [bacterium]
MTEKHTIRRVLSIVLRVGVSVALFFLLIRLLPSFDADELWPGFNSATPFWLAGALGLTVVGNMVATARWYEVAVALGLKVKPRRMFSHYMAGMFISNFVPTTVGGDVLRMSRLSNDTGDGPHSFASVLLERLSGWIVLPVITLLGLALDEELRGLGAPTRVAASTAGLTLLALGLILMLVGNQRFGRLVSRRNGWVRFVNGLHMGIDELRAKPRDTGRVLITAFAYQAVMLAAAGCAAKAVGIDVLGPTELMTFIPAVLIIQVLPIGLGGLGLREGALVLFLHDLGVIDERAIAMGLLLYFLTVAGSLVGLPALVFGGQYWQRASRSRHEH